MRQYYSASVTIVLVEIITFPKSHAVRRLSAGKGTGRQCGTVAGWHRQNGRTAGLGRSSSSKCTSSSSGAAACTAALQLLRRGLVPCLPAAASFLLFSTRCVNTKYCINSEKVHEKSLFGPFERDIAVFFSGTMHPNSGYRGRGGGGGQYNGHRPHNSGFTFGDDYLFLPRLDQFAVSRPSLAIFSHKKLRRNFLHFRLQLCSQRKGTPQAARAHR